MQSHKSVRQSFTSTTSDTSDEPLSKDQPRESDSSARPEYSIAAVSKLTGINCHTLRVWERRYGFPVPGRSPSGHRRYTQVQVQSLRQLIQLNATRQSQIGELIAEWRAGRLSIAGEAANEVVLASPDFSAELVRLLLTGDEHGAEREFEDLAEKLPAERLLEQVISPAFVEAGDGWFRRSHSVFHERLITCFLRRKLAGMISKAVQANTAPVNSVIVGTVQGDRHEGGTLAFTLAMELRNWRVHNLGVDLPVREFRLATEQLRVSALAISFILSRNIKKRFKELEKVHGLPVFVGGRSIVNYQSLARGHGLIPLAGPIHRTADQFISEFKYWCRSQTQAQ